MSRSGYSDDCEQWALICWRGAVASAMRGKRGQAFLKELLASLEALDTKRLIKDELVEGGEVCAIGAVGAARGIDMSNLDPDDRETIAGVFGIAPAMAAEIVYINDDEWGCYGETSEQRYQRMCEWVRRQLKTENKKDAA